MRYHERIVMLSVLDGLWKDHLLAMDHLKEGIGLRGYAQQDPLVAYKKESFDMFEAMMLRFQEDTARHLFRMQIIGPDGQPIETAQQLEQAQLAAAQPQPPAAETRTLQAPTASAPPVLPGRAPTTTIDALEREFQKKKERELERSRQAGVAVAEKEAGPRATGQKVGRNDKCTCGSGKKFKNCCGIAA